MAVSQTSYRGFGHLVCPYLDYKLALVGAWVCRYNWIWKAPVLVKGHSNVCVVILSGVEHFLTRSRVILSVPSPLLKLLTSYVGTESLR